MGTKKADRLTPSPPAPARSSISKLEIGSETVMGDSRSAQNPKEVEGGRRRARRERKKAGRKIHRAGVCPPPTVSLCVCVNLRLRSSGDWDGIDGKEVYPSQFPNSKVSLSRDEYST